MPRGRAAILILDLNIDSKVLRTPKPRRRDLYGPPRRPTDACASRRYSNYAAPPLAFMTVDSGTRWLPEPLNLRLKVGAGVPPSGPTTGCHQPQSFGRRPNGGRAL